ncbi:hypothetical protein [Leuconostoc mesenteroides]|jgi:hypothetical protein|nr:hypothetical protein [Leuconostoc mesenteroides]
MAEIKNEMSIEKETSLNEWEPLFTDIELMAFWAHYRRKLQSAK